MSEFTEITVSQLEQEIESICEKYDQGDSTVYKVVWTDDNGTEKAVILQPFDGPYSAVVQQFPDSDDLFVELPNRLVKKQGWNENTQLQMTEENGSIILKEKDSNVS